MIHYPRRLMPRGATAALAALMVAWQANEIGQWIEWPGHTFYTPLLALFGLAVAAAIRQWQCSSREPESRAAMKWFFLSTFISMGLALAVYFVPLTLGAGPLLPPVAMVGFASTLYLGLAAGVLERALAALGDTPEQVSAWLGPAVGPAAFEVGPEVRAAFREGWRGAPGAVDDCFRAGRRDRLHADLQALARLRLRAAGVGRIHGDPRCTASQPRSFFSHRRDGETGRMASLIMILPR